MISEGKASAVARHEDSGLRSWEAVQERLAFDLEASLQASPTRRNPALEEKSVSSRLVVACFVQEWSPESQSTAASIRGLQEQGDLDFVTVFILDADSEKRTCAKFDIAATPALVLFWNGQPMTIHRQGWNADNKICGCLSQDNLLMVCQHARACGESGQQDLSLEC